MPETYAVLPSAVIVRPPLLPGTRMIWTTLRVLTLTIRMSLTPRPADSVHRKRPSGVSRPLVGKLPSFVSLPTGLSLRPLGWMRLAGPMRPLVFEDEAETATAARTARTRTAASRAAAGGRFLFRFNQSAGA